jgi:uncharacterized protein (DUF1499 family)
MTVRLLVFAAIGIAVLVFFVLLAARLRPRVPSPGLEEGKLKGCPDSPNCVVSEGGDAAHSVRPIPFRGSADQAMADLAAVLAGLPRARVVAMGPDYLHAEFRSRLFGYVDDFEARADAASRTLHVRSASRSGHSDLGVNRERVELIRAALAKRGSGDTY